MRSSVTKRPNFTMVQLHQLCTSVELHFELHPSSFSATTFSISIVENLELGVVDWEEGRGLSGKCDSVLRVDCKKLHTQNLLWHIIAER